MTDEERTQFDKLTEELADTRRSQAGSDRTVVKLQAELAEATKQPEPTTAPDADRAKLDASLALIDRRERIYQMAITQGTDPAQAIKLLMGNDDAERLEMIDEIRQTERNAVLKSNGRNPHQSLKLTYDPWDIMEINKLPDDEIKRLAPGVVDAALTRHLDSLKAAKTPGLGARLKSSLFGSK